jgi:dTDP-glucose pyrophosphorylase
VKGGDILNSVISNDCTVSQAIEKLNIASVKTIYVADSEGRLVGSITDGDVRRGLLDNVALSDSVEKITFKSPQKIYISDTNKNELLEKYAAQGMLSVPIVDFEEKIVDIIMLKKAPLASRDKMSVSKDNFVFILAGGEGSRLRPLTNIIPKPLIPVGDSPILEIIMDKFRADGYNRFILSVNYKAELIKLYFNNLVVRKKYDVIEYVEENTPLGTIGSLFYAKKHLTEDFFISNADILIDEDFGRIMDYHKESNAAMTIVGCVKKSVMAYGVLEVNEAGELVAMEEKPLLKHIVNTGLYVAKPEVVDYIEEGQHTDITYVIESLLKARKKICVYRIDDEQWSDMGQWDELGMANLHSNIQSLYQA